MEKLKATFELEFLPAIGEQAEVTDALKAGWQHMKEKTADEFVGVQRHRAARRIGFAAPVDKGDFAIGHGLDAVVGNGHSMRVTAKVLQHGFG
jgi:hypothetical protein